MNWLKKAMVGRYGVDQLSQGMILISVVTVTISMLTNFKVTSYIGMVILIISYFRMFSRNINKRQQENLSFLKWWNPIVSKVVGLKNRVTYSKTHKFFKCPQCKKTLKVPKGKGRINITCPDCKTKFENRT